MYYSDIIKYREPEFEELRNKYLGVER